jgi:Tat protein secretion system quality control protein TatD with DNase activity
VRAFGKVLEIAQQEGPFPHGFILHSWAGNMEMVKAFCKVEGVCFSISGHTMSTSSKKAMPMLREVKSLLTPQIGRGICLSHLPLPCKLLL